MQTQPVFVEEWSDEQGSYVPTTELIGYRTVSDRGDILGFGDTREIAVENARRSMWRVDKCDGLVPLQKLLERCIMAIQR